MASFWAFDRREDPRTASDMTKWLSWSLRILFAAAGLTYILLNVSFRDEVLVPANTLLDDGTTVGQPTLLAVVNGDLSWQAGRITLQIARSDGGPFIHTIDAEQLGVGKEDYQPKPGMLTMLRQSNLVKLLLGLLMVMPAYLLGALRWWLLMRCRRLDVTLWRAFRLAMVGNFFNFCMPVGTTGGDLVKAYYAAKYSQRRADMLMSVVVDRVTGLLGLVVLAAVAGLFILREPIVAMVTMVLGISIIVLGVIAACYFTPAIRRASGFDWILGRLPGHKFFAQIDEAAVAYKHHKLAIAAAICMSVVVHACLATATGLAGYALGMQTPFCMLLNVVPILFLAAAMPLTYQGLGVMEWLATTMILNPPTTMANHVLGMLLLVRIFQIFFAMCGSLFLLSGDIHMHSKPNSD